MSCRVRVVSRGWDKGQGAGARRGALFPWVVTMAGTRWAGARWGPEARGPL